jgi:uncharacterized protein (DUF1697 family)
MVSGRFVALLRAINVGGRATIAMADLRRLFADLGFIDVQTVLQSGSVVFTGTTGASADLEELLEHEAALRLSLATEVLVRDADEWRRIMEENPFGEAAQHDSSHLLVMVLKRPVEAKSVDSLQHAVKGPEQIVKGDRVLYITYPDGIGRSRLTNALIESKLQARGTGRNWNTALKIAALLDAKNPTPD